MLNNNLENKGIYGYAKSKEKKNIDTILDSSAIANGETLDDFQPAKELSEVGETLKRVENYNNLLGNKDERSAHYFNAARESLVPQDTEERRRRNFVLSQNIANDAVADFYEKSVRPEFEKQRILAEEDAENMYKKSAGTPGVHPFSSLGAARRAADPDKVMNSTMERLDNEQLNKLADAYARYGGIDTDTYRDVILKPNIQNRMYNEYIKENTPKNSLEYIARNAYDNSVSGKLTNIALDEYSRTNTQRILDNESMQNYNANRAENFAASVGSLLIDSGVFAGLGSAASKLTGKATSAITKNLTSRVMSKGAARGISEETARRIVDRTFIDKIGTRIATGGSAQGLTLGAYDATNSVADDLLYGDSIDTGKAAGSFAKGFGTGMMLSAVGTPLKAKARGLTSGKKLAASAGVLSAESAVFTMGTEIDKLANDVEIEPIDLLSDFGESAATLLTMRMSHWRPKGYREKLNNDGHLKSEFSFNPTERQEMWNAGVNPEKFISSIEQELHPNYPSLHGNARREFINNYEGLMSTEGLSASTRAKLLYLVENKLTSTPPVPVDYNLEMSDGTAQVSIKDNAGRNIQRLTFESRAKADAFIERNSGLLRRNRIATIEDSFQRSIDSENFFRQAGEYAKETGVSIEEIANAMYKKAKQQSLNNREIQLIDDIMNRSSYNDIEIGNIMHDIRKNIEQRYGLNTGALINAIDKNRADCTVTENKALSEYEDAIRHQAEMLRSGVTEEMHRNAERLIAEQGLVDYDNEHIREYEKAYDTSVRMRPLRGNPNIKDYYKQLYPNEYADALENGFSYPADGEPPVPLLHPRNPTKGYMYSHDDLARLAVNARDIAKRLNANVEFIYDPHQISPSHSEYSKMTMAKGWYDRGNDKIIVNLANNKNAEDIEFTLLHEVVGHRGLYKLFGEDYIDFLDEVKKRSPSRISKQFKISSWETERDMYDKIDEYLAGIAEKTNKTPEERGILQRFKNFLGNALYRIGLPVVRDLNEKKIAMLLSRHRDAIESRLTPEKHRRKVFGSFNSSHSGNYGSETAMDDIFPKYRYRFIGEKGFENILKAKKEREGAEDTSRKFYYHSLDEIDHDSYINDGYKDIDANSYKRARKFYDSYMDKRNKFLENYFSRKIGENGIRNLMTSGNWDLYIDKYELANKLREYDYSPRLIKKKTGWEIGADGKWRYEIDDRNINIEYYPLMRMRKEYPLLYRIYKGYRNGAIKKSSPYIQANLESFHILLNKYLNEKPKLYEVIPDKIFFDAYPEYRNVTVVYKNYLERPCVYDKRKRAFFIDKSMVGKRELNLHAAAEMQRMIQDYEGFSKAYSMENVLPYDVYDQAVEPIDKSDMFEFMAEKPDNYFEKKEAYHNKYGFLPREVPESESEREDFILSLINGKTAAQSGNVEMRNVKSRFEYPDWARRESMAEDTEDISRKMQISPHNIYDVRKFLKGPIDIIKETNSKLWRKKYDEDGELYN